MAKKFHAVMPATIDVGEAQLAFNAKLAELEDVSRSELVVPRFDLQLTSAIAYSVAMRDFEEPRRGRLTELGTVFDFNLLEGLSRRCLEVFHALRKQSEATDAASAARGPELTMHEG